MMSLDPYSGMPGVEDLGSNTYRVTVRAATRSRIREARLSFRLMETLEESRRVFSPLLDRFYAGESYRDRPVKISDSGRIRNELQTWCSEALEHFAEDGMRVRLNDVEDSVLSPEKKKLVRDVCSWYKQNHPTWFRWLEIV
jgi:transposase